MVKEDNGDITIKFDEAQVNSINDIMSKIQKCQPTRKRGIDATCFVGSAEFLLINTLKGPMADLAVPVENIPHPGGVDPDAHAMLLALHMFILSARKIYTGAFGKVLDAKIPMTDIELTVFWIVYIIATGSPLKVENKIKSDKINPHCKPPRYECPDEACKGKLGYCTTGDQIGCTCEEEECPPADRTPSCPNCGGDDGSTKCIGVSTYATLPILHSSFSEAKNIKQLKDPEDMWKGFVFNPPIQKYYEILTYKDVTASLMVSVQSTRLIQSKTKRTRRSSDCFPNVPLEIKIRIVGERWE